MGAVKGSKQHRMVVVPYRPLQRWAVVTGIAVAFAVGLVVSFYHGHSRGVAFQEEALAERQQLKQKLREVEKQRDHYRQQAANFKVGSEVDRKASEGVRQEVIQLKETITKLEQDISFYRGLMAPSGNKRGLTIGSLDVLSTGAERRYQYKVVLQQLAVNHGILSGYFTFQVAGKLNGEPKVLALKEISPQVDRDQIKLRFKYFQTFEGQLELPEGFEPERIELVARSTGKNAATVEKNFGWIIQES